MAFLQPGQHLNRNPQFCGGALAGKRLTQSPIQLSLESSNETFVLLEEHAEPWVILRSQEVGDHEGPSDAIAEQSAVQ